MIPLLCSLSSLSSPFLSSALASKRNTVDTSVQEGPQRFGTRFGSYCLQWKTLQQTLQFIHLLCLMFFASPARRFNSCSLWVSCSIAKSGFLCVRQPGKKRERDRVKSERKRKRANLHGKGKTDLPALLHDIETGQPEIAERCIITLLELLRCHSDKGMQRVRLVREGETW
jgi:hypothetical protein